jgi:IMP cyclohydrolase
VITAPHVIEGIDILVNGKSEDRRGVVAYRVDSDRWFSWRMRRN